MKRHLSSFQTGAAAVEMAILFGVFAMLLLGTMEMGRVMFYWNTATELTRMGARMAAVCNVGEPVVAQQIAAFYPLIPANKVLLEYTPSGCTAANCTEVTVRVEAGLTINTYIPFVPLGLTLPEFRTTLPRESLASSLPGVQGGANPVCAAP
ncbi:TadE/TadG family type IV pilus assembly protein [Uliginosibacterium aquaticum]|uniref:Pilus assembly protein n=1 Tax=Uliginosibacterium aquaticum TaxID=2731212 RepID=A0ABX2IIB1_9RHOO|nr:TadE/TadG family type IV pilus assembly protein [Uliginosibacterium aquaticum]NSL54732.1 pilus assembly protein [Uliginosibacterium aquaticum]